MSLVTNRRAEQFAELLDADTTSDDPVAGPLLAVAEALRELPTVPAPRPEFRAALRQRMVAVAAVQGAVAETESPLRRARAASATWKVQRRLSAVAAGAAVVTGIAGVGVGASRSIPGQPFYGVKRAAEDAQLATTVGTEARGKRHLQFARTRLEEVRALSGTSAGLAPAAVTHAVAAAAGAGKSTLIEDTLQAMDAQTRVGANDLFTAFRDSGSQEPLQALNSFARDQYRSLQSVVPALPEAARPAAAGSLSLLAYVATNTVTLSQAARPGTHPQQPPGPSTTAPPPTTPSGTRGTRGPSSRPASTGPADPPASPSSRINPVNPTNPVNPVTPVTPPSVLPIPSLPTTIPVPTKLPTELPSLPDLGGLLGH